MISLFIPQSYKIIFKWQSGKVAKCGDVWNVRNVRNVRNV